MKCVLCVAQLTSVLVISEP